GGVYKGQINESSVVCGPIGCTVDFRCRLIHLKIILWNKPLEIGLCNKADLEQKDKDREIFLPRKSV
ncbi:hypothetical protein DV997_08240, partial [Acinetobacter baumannii]